MTDGPRAGAWGDVGPLPFGEIPPLLELLMEVACPRLFDTIEAELGSGGNPGVIDLFKAYLFALDAEPLFSSVGSHEGSAALGRERWDELVERLILVPFGNLLDPLVDPSVWVRMDRQLYVKAVVGGLEELRVAITGSPDVALARCESGRLLRDLARPVSPPG